MEAQRRDYREIHDHRSSIEALRHRVEDLETTIGELTRELAAERANKAKISTLLERAYRALKQVQLQPQQAAPPKRSRSLSALWPATDSDHEPFFRFWMQPRRTQGDSRGGLALHVAHRLMKPRSRITEIVRSDLERQILRDAHRHEPGIAAVIIEFAKPEDQDRGTNWRIAGVVSGRANREAAIEAVQAAVEENTFWTMVEDVGSRTSIVRNVFGRRGNRS